MPYTSPDNYFEHFTAGDRYEHVRGRTVSNVDNLWLTLTTLNTAQGHFNLDYIHRASGGLFTERLVMGGATLAIVIGLTAEDMSENALADLGLTGVRLPAPVYRGDTLYAHSEVVELSDAGDRPDAGVMTYRFTGRKGDGTVVVEGTRRVLLKRFSHWAERDGHVAEPEETA
ncbi:acyl dehydratase [Thermocatellispora tengchongensis]|uniref:Acyl dehydratase n=1 Tax=Thermocatellispora tengchongensis TaxID=1073253 RepID=A0A840PPW7_9ACTN|nr:MaoC family dehydratase [Thermocatellispora tengchongensis]MBB5140113.1 acyl dehydratase [Thermocatellispora tengchongensis]